LKHHYLAVPEEGYLKKIEENKKRYDSKSYLDDLLFIKSWDAKVVVSTYVQLLHTIIGGKNSFMNKFHNIVNSIIILDEVQCIDLKYWEIIRDLFKQLGEKFNIYFIFVTATQPLIFDKADIKELGMPEEFFNNPVFNRVKVNENLEKSQTIDEFYENFKLNEVDNLKNRYLFVLNTKRSSLNLYKKFREDKEQKGLYKEHNLIYLSTNLTPNDRWKKIDYVINNNRDPEQKYIIVTTQLVEAGVDISSDVCYRDFAPIDSIIQSAGRCNRFGEIEKGEFNVIKLCDEDKQKEFSWIYGRPILERTEKTINENRLEESMDFFNIASEFFENCWTKSGDTKEHSEKLFANLYKLDYDSILSGKERFRFIETYPTHTVFILDKDSYPEFEKYKKILKKRFNNDDEFESIKKGELKKQRKVLNKFTIEITPKQLNSVGWIEKDEDFGEEFYFLRVDESLKDGERLYSKEQGFNLDYDTEGGEFI
ncbi:MAG: CRISPR-associated helicase Cas3', partial [Candidatus Woesearchaeota archaeon]